MAFLCLPFVLSLAAAFLPAICAQSDNSTTFDWSALQATPNLTWVDCYGSIFQCTRLQVPFDHSNPGAGTAGIAILRLPATVDTSSKDYRGPILFNPGGPGSGGVDAVRTVGPSFRALIGGEYDFYGFDPRGVGFSTPSATFFSASERAQWNAGSFPTSLNSSSEAVKSKWGAAQIFGQLAAQRDTTGIFKYITTDNVARDMLYISQKAGYEKLSYYGISYGTVLGATFAAMFPNKINRMIIDGVVDAEAWYHANLTIAATDTDKALQFFFTSCVSAGPEVCAFYKSTPETISARLEKLTNAVRAKPVPAVTPAGYGLVDYSLLRSVVFQALYTPYASFPVLAQGLANLEHGDASIIFGLSDLAAPLFQCTPADESAGDNGLDSGVGIECGDMAEVTDPIDQLTAKWLQASKVSRFAEFLAGSMRVQCSGWKIHRKGRFLGPVSARNTSFPLLIVTNVADPVAPSIGARNTQSRFPGSVLLTQNSPGHTTLTTPSLCTYAHYRAYLVNGTLPAVGTVCEPEAKLFAPAAGNSARAVSAIGDLEQVGQQIVRGAIRKGWF
ncbi:unnamed protein product [Mycena citricolor]|uniref:Alpha/beta-hydrolase n=1 Tax=Mycena citricolor TaxID=2018698 RepID=A0AAD2HLK7_9AGAR|nr:unnamed protein product [Mycena citricolor]CAK5277040.1 unnamed protein product [Mycena citricolor]